MNRTRLIVVVAAAVLLAALFALWMGQTPEEAPPAAQPEAEAPPAPAVE